VLALSLFAAGGCRADGRPTPQMMAAVRALADFMASLRPDEHPRFFAARGLCIVENFAPFLFCGPRAAAAWEAGFRAHAAGEDLSALAAGFGAAHDFTAAGGRAYFSLPTTWTGRTHGRNFQERGAWAFVLERHGRDWRILGYGWGVTGYRESAP
jgi:hypothetical protein